METKVNYALVGVFVLLLGTLLIAGVLWLASGGALRKQFDLYLAVEEESVAGLNLNAPVKYNGVDIGKVQQIQLDSSSQERVNLILAIERGIPIKEDTIAVLKTQGLTGIAYVELSGGSAEALPLPASVAGSPYPVIRTKPSLATRLENKLISVLAKLENTATGINTLLGAENQAAIKGLLADTASVANTVAKRKDSIDSALLAAASTLEHTAAVTAQLGPVLERIGRSADGAKKMVNSGDILMQRFNTEMLPEMERLLAELNLLSTSLRRLSEQTERNPSSLLFGRRPAPAGPGESFPGTR